ncbi:hypothetical protein [Tsuneonella mangrovi]|uniref:hypothetical protein n=1 Tax=Tsuneonella mangrovi TaxID=1982042 RepID=UPI00123790DB|nr:hypothetical protein [Tsuneonella mangrovi]
MKAVAMALPETLVSQATVELTQADGTTTTVQQGSGELTCTVSSSDRRGIKNRLLVICPPESVNELRPQLKAIKDKSADEDAYRAAVAAAVKDGTIKLPKPGTTGYGFMGGADSWGKDPAQLKDAVSWQYVLEPMMTGADLGLPEKRDGTMPWLMASGRPFAHIMLSGKPE